MLGQVPFFVKHSAADNTRHLESADMGHILLAGLRVRNSAMPFCISFTLDCVHTALLFASLDILKLRIWIYLYCLDFLQKVKECFVVTRFVWIFHRVKE